MSSSACRLLSTLLLLFAAALVAASESSLDQAPEIPFELVVVDELNGTQTVNGSVLSKIPLDMIEQMPVAADAEHNTARP